MDGPQALPVADRPGGAVPGLRRLGMHALTGWGVWFWIGPIVVLGVVPADRPGRPASTARNPPDDVIEALENDRYYRWITYLFLPIQYAGFVGGVSGWSARGDLAVRATSSASRSRSAASAASASTPPTSSATRRRATSAGCPRSRWRRASTATSTSSTTAATTSASPPRRTRPAAGSARASTSSGRARSSARCAAPGASRSAATPARSQHPFRIGNDVLNAWLMSAVLWGALVAWLGVGDPAVPGDPGGRRLLAARGGQLHGALRHAPAARSASASGSATSGSTPRTRWNSNNIATNVLLYHLQRHSDHHANPTRRYQTLRDFEESPVLPTGYAGMIVLALVPPLWRRVMDPRVLAHFDGDMSRANLRPAQARAASSRRTPPAPGCGAGPVLPSQAVPAPASAGGLAYRCPGCAYTYEVAGRRRARGLRRPARRGPTSPTLVLPGLRRARQGRLRRRLPGGWTPEASRLAASARGRVL